MMEPVAYAAFADNGNIRIWSQEPGRVDAAAAVDDFKVEPLVRLSEAEARIAELERQLRAAKDAHKSILADERARAEAAEARIAEITKWRDEWKDMATELKSLVEEWQARAEAAEALLKEAGKALEQQRKALEPLSSAVFNDNGDISVSYPVNFTSEHCIAAYFADRAARAIHDKIGVKDE